MSAEPVSVLKFMDERKMYFLRQTDMIQLLRLILNKHKKSIQNYLLLKVDLVVVMSEKSDRLKVT